MKRYHYNENLFVRHPEPGMGLAVARRTVFRKVCPCGTKPWASEERCPKCGAMLDESTCEDWGDVATRVALGNTSIHPSGVRDLLGMERHIASGALLTSGRHLQHGDATQPQREINLYSNCSTASTSFEKFFLLLSGSGVGRCYDDNVMVVDWRDMPEVHCVLSADHPDYEPGLCPQRRGAHGLLVWKEHRLEGDLVEFDVFDQVGTPGRDYYYFVQDSREGWARAVELMEGMARQGWSHRKLVLDFSFVRPKGSPIVGMQYRPSAGPVPTIKAIRSICEMAVRARAESWPRWKQALYVDHYLADCVHLGGARRAARISVKHWRDPGILEYCRIKQDGGLWSANMSVGLDEEFYECLALNDVWARKVANAIVDGQYVDLTGEPGSINQHRLHAETKGVFDFSLRLGGKYPPLTEMAAALKHEIREKLIGKKWIFITNPCSEISLILTGGYCIVMDVAPCSIPKLDEYYEKSRKEIVRVLGETVEEYLLRCDERGVELFFLEQQIQAEFEDTVRHAARACIRVNMLPAHFQGEVNRTNRIGISLAGIHEYAWMRFGFTFRDLLDERKSKGFWDSVASARRALHDECVRYSEEVGVAPPHTESAFKPGGSVPKIHGLSECANLPSLPYMIRWIQFAKGDPRVAEYESAGYPVMRDVRSYEMSEIVGFPTQMPIAELMGDKLVTAGEATPEEHYQWLRLLEKYWIVGVNENGTPMEDRGNQVAYTLKFDPKKVSRQEWFETWRRNQATVRCCAVMPQVDATAYAYQPEEPITRETYLKMVSKIRPVDAEAFDPETATCTTGACPL